MKLKSMILILALLIPTIAVAIPTVHSYPPTTFLFDENPAPAHVGSELWVRIKLDYVTDLNAWEARIRWNNVVLKYKDVVWGWLAGEDIGDFNLDGVVDSTDLGIMGGTWGLFKGDRKYVGACDMNEDGVVDSTDLGIEGGHWGHFQSDYIDPDYPLVQLHYLTVVGNELDLFEGFMDQGHVNPVGMNIPFVLATVKFDVIAGGTSKLEFLDDEGLWGAFGAPIPYTSVDGSAFTYEPFVDFKWTPSLPAIEETIAFDGSASASADGDTITGYSWSIDGQANGTAVTTTGLVHAYSKTAHTVSLTVTDSGGDSYTLTKSLTIDRDIAIFSIWPSEDDLQGTILFKYNVGKMIGIGVRIANIGTIPEFTNNSRGDFPQDIEQDLWLVENKSLPTEKWKKIGKTGGGGAAYKIYRYRYSVGPTQDDWYYYYDWQPLVGSMKWYLWDTYGMTPEDNLYLYANFSQTFVGDTDTSNDFMWFGPFNLTTNYAHDIRLDGIWTYDAVSYVQAMPPYPGTTFKFYYGPYAPGAHSQVTVGLRNVGLNDETDVEVYITIGSNAPGAEELIDSVSGESRLHIDLAAGEYNELTWDWDTTGFYGQYTLYAHIKPVPGEDTGPAKYNTWDNNVPGQDIAWWNGYDDWGIFL